jgi:hypothetical protein
VEDDDLQGGRRRIGEPACGVLQLPRADAPGLMEPGTHGVQADDVQPLRSVGRLRRLPVTLELLVRAREARDRGVWNVVVTGHGENGSTDALEEPCGAVVLFGTAPVGQVTARDDQLGVDALDQVGKARLEPRLLVCAHMKIREVKESRPAGGHSRGRLYTQIVVDEPTEIFDDLYLGLRAGGALRKKRRGEPLTSEEEEALGRWQRLARVRKAVALGAFTLGTFGLGFTIGGLIFGRWRRA